MNTTRRFTLPEIRRFFDEAYTHRRIVLISWARKALTLAPTNEVIYPTSPNVSTWSCLQSADIFRLKLRVNKLTR